MTKPDSLTDLEARNGRQVTEDELKNMTAEQIVAAQNAGLLATLLGDEPRPDPTA